ncbi:Zn-dependent hydrolase, partial [Klebsiella pneumoniae]
MSHYLQINGQRLIDSLYALGEHGALARRGVLPPGAPGPKKNGRGVFFCPHKGRGRGGGNY